MKPKISEAKYIGLKIGTYSRTTDLACTKYTYITTVEANMTAHEAAHDRGGPLQPTIDIDEIPLAWLSKTLSPAEQKWPANERELFAIVSALRWYPELFAGRWVTILTDNTTLTSWASITLSSNRLCKWQEDMQEFMVPAAAIELLLV